MTSAKIKRILVPLDFSAESVRALTYALALGRRARSEYVLVHALEPFYLHAPGDSGRMVMVMREFTRMARARLSQLAARFRLSSRTHLIVRQGPPAEVIVACARTARADLIVMSTHGRTGLARAFIGSIAERVVQRAGCPVLTLPAKRARLAPLRAVGSEVKTAASFKSEAKRRAASP